MLVEVWLTDHFGTTQTARPSGAIVVLGARVQVGGVPSATLRARAIQGAALHHAGLAPLVLFSGGVGEHGPSEASVARDVAVEAGVPAASCVLEEQSHSTRQNAKYSAALLRARGVTEVIVVSDPYHLRRASWLFEQEGFRVTVSPVLRAPRHESLSSRVGWTVRDTFALLKEVVVPGSTTVEVR